MKTAYRTKNPDVKVEIGPPEAETPPVAADEAVAALKGQMDAQRKATAHQRQHEKPPGIEDTRKAKLAQWRQGGMSDADEWFLAQHPEMIDHEHVTGEAVREALAAGHPYGTPEFHEGVKDRFDRKMAVKSPAAEKTPEFFAPPESAPESAEPDMSAIVSAPVSRGVPSGGAYRPAGSGTVRLTATQREAARIAGISETEYARQLTRFEAEKAAGNIQQGNR